MDSDRLQQFEPFKLLQVKEIVRSSNIVNKDRVIATLDSWHARRKAVELERDHLRREVEDWEEAAEFAGIVPGPCRPLDRLRAAWRAFWTDPRSNDA